jgi:hypothetical protein
MGLLFSVNDADEPARSNNGALNPGVYTARVLDSKFERTKTEVILNGQGEYVRRVRDYNAGTDAPMTGEEHQRGFTQSTSGTYVYLLLGCDVDGMQYPWKVIVRFNLENVIADPWSGRKLFRQLLSAVGLEQVPLEIGQSILPIHEKPFLVELVTKEKRNMPGEMENEAKSIAPLTSQPKQATPMYIPPAGSGVEVVDIVGASRSYGSDDGMF